MIWNKYIIIIYFYLQHLRSIKKNSLAPSLAVKLRGKLKLKQTSRRTNKRRLFAQTVFKLVLELRNKDLKTFPRE